MTNAAQGVVCAGQAGAPLPSLIREMVVAIYDWESSSELAEELAVRLYGLIIGRDPENKSVMERSKERSES
jgi:hypothetical protein